MDKLKKFGWTARLADNWESLGSPELQPARIVADFGTSVKIALPEIYSAEISARLSYSADRQNVPKIGDWVAVSLDQNQHGLVEFILPRQSELARKAAGNQTIKQVIAANIDIAFVLLALDADFNIKRLERFLYQLSVSHIAPIIVLNKADKVKDLKFYTDQLEVFKLPIIISIATSGRGLSEIAGSILPGKTAILLGSSGVGKSTLTNKLLGRDSQATQETRAADDSGKHTTVHRELFLLPNGGLLVDTPGIRELQLWGTPDDLADNFDDIKSLISDCQYSNCHHDQETGCAVKRALSNGALSQKRYESYKKLNAELTKLERQKAVRQQKANRRPRRDY